MGAVTMGPPSALTLLLQRELQLSTFIETGTFRGATARWAAEHFETVVTIEAAAQLHAEAALRHREAANIRFVLADSRDGLRSLLPELTSAALFWLDSHWCGELSHGAGATCPLIDELTLLAPCADRHVVMIDDARLFLSPPPLPHDLAAWPELAQVFEALQRFKGPPRYTVIIDDVIVSVPASGRTALATYCQRIATEQWNARLSAPGVRGGLRTLLQGARDTVKAVRRLGARGA
jgi:hypothetical protein